MQPGKIARRTVRGIRRSKQRPAAEAIWSHVRPLQRGRSGEMYEEQGGGRALSGSTWHKPSSNSVAKSPERSGSRRGLAGGGLARVPGPDRVAASAGTGGSRTFQTIPSSSAILHQARVPLALADADFYTVGLRITRRW
jgi:hypothetical protein